MVKPPHFQQPTAAADSGPEAITNALAAADLTQARAFPSGATRAAAWIYVPVLLYLVYRLMAWTYTLIREDPNACMHVFVVAALASVAATALATGSWQRICEVGFSLCAAAALWIPHEFMMQADSASPMASSFTAIAQFSAAAVTTFAVVLAATSGVALIVVTARAIHARLAQPLARRRDSLIKD